MAPILHRAGWIMIEPDVWLENGVVEVKDGRITDVGTGRGRDPVMDHGPGVILPALLNAHAHLSLSALKDQVDSSRGFVNWVSELIKLRAELPEQEMKRAAMAAAISAANSGTGFMAEVGPTEPGASAIRGAGMEGIIFEEVLGSCRDLPSLPKASNGLAFSYAGHALHTTAPGVLQKLKTATSGGVFSFHLAESDAEVEFLETGQGAWAELLTARRIDFSDWGPWGERPIPRAHRLGLLGPGTLAVHALHVDSADMETLAATGASVCVCPRSNWELHGRLPKIHDFLQAGLACALGTDSLASCPTLSMFDEMAFVSERYPELDPLTILSLSTVNPAQGLGRMDLGRVRIGYQARLIYVDLVADSAALAAFKLVSGQFGRVEWL